MAVAIITGASRGLGLALAEALAESGWSLVVDGRDGSALARADGAIGSRLAGGRLVAVPGDVADAAHRRRLLDAASELGELELIVNNASVLGPSPQPTLADYPLDVLRDVFEVNTFAPLALVQLALPALRRARRPRVINITSDASVEHYGGWGGYGSSKAALDHLGAVLGIEEPEVRFWTVDPGNMRTQMHQEAFPGEDISDRPEPSSVVPALLALIDSRRRSGRYRASDLPEAARSRS
jgi:NAD(P)-dependent dehydrogenase (short-subunit alcohol dehydrogenase family)